MRSSSGKFYELCNRIKKLIATCNRCLKNIKYNLFRPWPINSKLTERSYWPIK